MYGLFPMRNLHNYSEAERSINHRYCTIRAKEADIDLPLWGKRPYEHASCVLDVRQRISSVFYMQDKMFRCVVVREFQRGIYVGHLDDDTFGNGFANDVHALQCTCLSIHLRFHIGKDRLWKIYGDENHL